MSCPAVSLPQLLPNVSHRALRSCGLRGESFWLLVPMYLLIATLVAAFAVPAAAQRMPEVEGTNEANGAVSPEVETPVGALRLVSWWDDVDPISDVGEAGAPVLAMPGLRAARAEWALGAGAAPRWRLHTAMWVGGGAASGRDCGHADAFYDRAGAKLAVSAAVLHVPNLRLDVGGSLLFGHGPARLSGTISASVLTVRRVRAVLVLGFLGSAPGSLEVAFRDPWSDRRAPFLDPAEAPDRILAFSLEPVIGFRIE